MRRQGLEAKERGNEHFRAGSFVEAIKEYQDAVKRDPKNPAYRNNLAAALQKVLGGSHVNEAQHMALTRGSPSALLFGLV